MAKLGDVSLVKDCLICHREVILLARKDFKGDMPEKDSVLPQVCEKCYSKYLTKGVLLVNPDNGALVVLKDKAFKKVFNVPIPDGKIAFTEQRVLEMIDPEKFKLSDLDG